MQEDHEASNTFPRKSMAQDCLVFILAAKKATGKTYFPHYDISAKTFYTTV